MENKELNFKMVEATGVLCNACPYRKASAPGYLGGHGVQEYEQPIRQDILLPCHKTYGQKERPYCTGLAAVRVNSCKAARMPGVIADSERKVIGNKELRAKCFNWPHEFVGHHTKQKGGEGE